MTLMTAARSSAAAKGFLGTCAHDKDGKKTSACVSQRNHQGAMSGREGVGSVRRCFTSPIHKGHQQYLVFTGTFLRQSCRFKCQFRVINGGRDGRHLRRTRDICEVTTR